MNQLTIGLTGGIGSGKSFVSKHFESLGVDVIDADIISRQATMAGAPSLVFIKEHFGSDIFDESDHLNRSKLRSIIFNNSSEKQWLEDLLHPVIRNEIISQLKQSASLYTILSSPLLFETHQDELVDKTLVIDISNELQIERASKRDGGNKKIIQNIIDSQMGREERLERSDFIVSNSGSKIDTIAAIDKLHIHFLDLARQKLHDS